MAELRRNLARKEHVEAEVTDVPADLLGGPGRHHGMEAVERHPSGLSGDKRGRTSVAEHKERQQLLEARALVQVQGAEFEADEQDL